MDSKDLTIGVLSTTAVILFVGLVLVHTEPTPVYASGMGGAGGDYMMLSGELFDQEELLYVIDTSQNRLLTYRFNMNTGQVERASGEMLDRYFSVRKDPPDKKRRGRTRRRP